MNRQVRDAGHILVIASPVYKERAEGDAGRLLRVLTGQPWETVPPLGDPSARP